MAAENPNWHIMQHQTNIHSNSPLFSLLHHQLTLHGEGESPNNNSSPSLSTSSIPFNPLLDGKSPQPWSQILMSGGEEERLGLISHLDQPKANPPNNENMLFGHDDDHHEHEFIKKEAYGHGVDGHDMDYHHDMANMTHMVFPSPKSCNNNINKFMDFSLNSCKDKQHEQHSFESKNYATIGGAPKKPRVQPSIPPLKVRKEKLGDRITALHQLVSPFGKTDTASVLIETIGCIRFLQAQIQVLSSPYLDIPPSKNHHFNIVAKDERELRSKGLCLIPTTSLIHFVGMDNNSAAEYWAPSLADGF